MDYAMLSRYSIQSTSDEEDYRYYATIAANAPSGLTPEQAAVWSYPLPQGDREEVVFNMVNAMLLRVHQSGHLNVLSQERKDLVKEGLDYYKKIRHDIKEAVPFWPLRLSQFNDEWVSLDCERKIKSIWRCGEEVDPKGRCHFLCLFLRKRRKRSRSVWHIPLTVPALLSGIRQQAP